MYRNIFVASGLLALIFFTTCKSGMKKTESGLQYEFIRQGEGIKGDSGLILMLNIKYTDANDSVFFNSRDFNTPTPLNYPVPVRGLLQEGLAMLSKGDSIILKVPARDVFIMTFRRPVPEGVDPDSLLTFYIGVEDIYDRDQFNKQSTELNARMQVEAEKRSKIQLQTDIEIIESYLEKNGIVAEKTESGLFYVITEEGTGDTAKPGQKVSVNYSGYILDGAYFDTSIEQVAIDNGLFRPGEYKPIEFPLGRGAVIPGWDEGISLLNRGAKAALYIPSTLAYGERQRSDIIVANSILVFDVELVDIIIENQ